MAITYCRTDPLSTSPRWTGVGRLLTEYEVDYNFYQHETRIAVMEAAWTVTVSVSAITQPTASTLLFTMSDASTFGPFTMPVSTFRDRGAWVASTLYLVNDTFTVNGSLYRVPFEHTSGLTFSPTANDGLGHDYYAVMLANPGNALPTGGATDMMLRKSSSANYAVSWAYPLPVDGTTNQVLAKLSNTSQDADWITLAASMVSFTASTTSALVSTNVADAIEELETAVGVVAAATLTLEDLTDVNFSTTGPFDGSLMYYSGAEWIETAEPTTNDILQWDGSEWAGVPPTFAMLTGALTLSQLRNTTVTALGTTFGAIALDPALGNRFTWTPNGASTIELYETAGAEITLIILTSGTSSFNITAGGTTHMQGTLATGTVSARYFVLKFISNGSASWEVSRTIAMA